MSEEIKYEPIYGLQKPFDDGPEDAEAYGIFGNEVIYYKIDKTSVYCFDTDNQWSHIDGAPNIPFLAMRRIIKTPVWTVADQLERRMPEVGCECIYKDNYLVTFLVLYIDGEFICLKNSNGNVFTILVCDFMKSYRPIETPAEKAQRLEDEFVNFVLHHSESKINSSEELVAAKRAIKLAYKLQLSGELQAPKGGE